MKEILKKYLQLTVLIIVTLGFSVSLQSALAVWTAPTAAPTGGNIDAPINIGTTGQTKAGGLWLNSGSAPIGLVVQYGKVGIGAGDPGARLEVKETATLGAVSGASQIISRLSASTGNKMMKNEWLYRDAAGTDWLTARFHDGISVDSSFLTPGTNTRTWWERDPYNNIQSWGNSASAYLTINAGNVGIGTVAPGERLEVAGNVKITGAGLYNSFGKQIIETNDTNWTRWNQGSGASNGNAMYQSLSLGSGGLSVGAWSNQAVGDIYATGKLQIAGTGNSYVSGNLGIGTANPLSKLSVGANGISGVGIYSSASTGIWADSATGNGLQATGVTGINTIGSSIGIYSFGNIAVYATGNDAGTGIYATTQYTNGLAADLQGNVRIGTAGGRAGNLDILNGTIRGATYGFGGMYSNSGCYGCRSANPFTGACSCPDGFTAQWLQQFPEANCGWYTGNTYVCYK